MVVSVKWTQNIFLMKTSTFFALLFAALTLAPFSITAQQNLNVTGPAAGMALAHLEATDITASNDILEIDAPSSPTSTTGQFIECQTSTIKMQVNYDGSSFFGGEMNINSDIFLNDEGTQSSAEILMEDNANNQTIKRLVILPLPFRGWCGCRTERRKELRRSGSWLRLRR